MKVLIIICAILLISVGGVIFIFWVKLKINNRKSGYRVKLNEMCYEDEYADGLDFTYKRTKCRR